MQDGHYTKELKETKHTQIEDPISNKEIGENTVVLDDVFMKTSNIEEKKEEGTYNRQLLFTTTWDDVLIYCSSHFQLRIIYPNILDYKFNHAGM